MVNYKDPLLVEHELLLLVRSIFFCAGAYSWEFVGTFAFEWEIYTGRKRLTLPLMFYIASRWLVIIFLLNYIIGFSITTRIDCVALLFVGNICGYSAIVLASALIGLRAIALWGRKMIVILIVLITWLGCIAAVIYGLALTSQETIWNPVANICTPRNTHNHKYTLIVLLVSDTLLCVYMLAGVFHTKNSGHVWKLIFRQGVIWTVLATLTEIPATVLIWLNLNDALNLIVQPYAIVILVMAAGHLTRELNTYEKDKWVIDSAICTDFKTSSSVQRGYVAAAAQEVSYSRWN